MWGNTKLLFGENNETASIPGTPWYRAPGTTTFVLRHAFVSLTVYSHQYRWIWLVGLGVIMLRFCLMNLLTRVWILWEGIAQEPRNYASWSIHWKQTNLSSLEIWAWISGFFNHLDQTRNKVASQPISDFAFFLFCGCSLFCSSHTIMV